MAELSKEDYYYFEIYLGKEKADEVAKQVKNGVLTQKVVKEWVKKLQEMHDDSRGRRDIEPEEWPAFEDGWRPDNNI